MAHDAAARTAPAWRAQSALCLSVRDARMVRSRRRARCDRSGRPRRRARHHADGFRRGGHEPEASGHRAHQSHAARAQLRCDPCPDRPRAARLGAQGNGLEHSGPWLVERAGEPRGRSRHDLRRARSGGVNPHEASRVQGGRRTRNRVAAASDDPRHGRHGFRGTPSRRSAGGPGSFRDRADARPQKGARSAAAVPDRHRSRSDRAGYAYRCHRPSRRRVDQRRLVDGRAQACRHPVAGDDYQSHRASGRAPRASPVRFRERLSGRLVRASRRRTADRIWRFTPVLQP